MYSPESYNSKFAPQKWWLEGDPFLLSNYLVSFFGGHLFIFGVVNQDSSEIFIWVVVSHIFYFHPYLGKIRILTNIFQMGWFNHQLVVYAKIRVVLRLHFFKRFIHPRTLEVEHRYLQRLLSFYRKGHLQRPLSNVLFLSRTFPASSEKKHNLGPFRVFFWSTYWNWLWITQFLSLSGLSFWAMLLKRLKVGKTGVVVVMLCNKSPLNELITITEMDGWETLAVPSIFR